MWKVVGLLYSTTNSLKFSHIGNVFVKIKIQENIAKVDSQQQAPQNWSDFMKF